MSDVPLVAWANPKPHEDWRFYVDGAIKVRMLTSGVVQVATGEEDWRDA